MHGTHNVKLINKACGIMQGHYLIWTVSFRISCRSTYNIKNSLWVGHSRELLDRGGERKTVMAGHNNEPIR